MTHVEDPKGRKEGYVKEARKLVLLDMNHLMHRAYWAIQRNLATKAGEQTNAVYGAASMLLTLISREQPERIVACFDEGKETFRHKEHAAYKALRPDTPEDFYAQIPRIQELLQAFSIPILSNPTYEADDVIATLAKRGVEQGFSVTIVTGDRDLFQMASDAVRIAIPEKGYTEPQYLDAASVEQKLGVTPAQIPDYKGLMGDPSDNLRGVRGIGPKTASTLLKKYGSLEEIYAHLPEMRENVRMRLEADRESAFICKKLAQLVMGVPLTLDLSRAEPWRVGVENVIDFFRTLEFHTLARRFQNLLRSDTYMQAHFSGSVPAEVLEESPPETRRRGERRMTEDQLPLLD